MPILCFTKCLRDCVVHFVSTFVIYTFFVIVFYTLRFTNHVLSYYMFPPVARRRNARQAKS
ncbi:hypothetical protein HanHA300_Chr05g0193471 [Helianthus annuus]|nr:hypothetical protein HanHA300_Chr05g0193471 [Helianthus annuus]KAJ0586116.1 hypothetical protein HanHA89_Chr05g0208291 [Helianthus annuus]